MDRTGKFAVALAVITLMAWTYYNQKEAEKANVQRRAAAAELQEKQAADTQKNTPPPIAVATQAAGGGAAPPAADEKVDVLKGSLVEYTFSSRGGGISKALLLNHESERGRRMVLNEFGTIPIGAVSELPGEGATEPFSASVDAAAGSITYERTDARQLQISKKFSVSTTKGGSDDYVVKLDVGFTNRSAAPLTLPGYFVHTGAAAPIHQGDLANYTGLKAADGKFIDTSWFSAGGIPFLGGHPERPVFTESRSGIAWLAVANQYFTSLLRPAVTAADPAAQLKQAGASVWGARVPIGDQAWQDSGRSATRAGATRQAIQAALGMPGFTLQPGESVTQQFLIFTGPREYALLKRLGGTEEQIMDFGWFGLVSKTLLNAMNWLNSKLGSYAAAIIVLTLLIKSLLWPMQNKATQSMKRMQLLQPKMAEIKTKYGEDPARMNVETMKLYKDYGVNPLSGCLPMFIQFPIFLGFYNMLGRAVELRNSHILWIKDLSQPDTLFHVGDFPINVLPLVMAGTMLWQMRISPKSGDPVQQKMFMFMPLVFVAFCYNYASALALYWTVQNLFSVAQLYATRNQAAPQLVKAAPPSKKK